MGGVGAPVAPADRALELQCRGNQDAQHRPAAVVHAERRIELGARPVAVPGDHRGVENHLGESAPVGAGAYIQAAEGPENHVRAAASELGVPVDIAVGVILRE